MVCIDQGYSKGKNLWIETIHLHIAFSLFRPFSLHVYAISGTYI